MEEGLTGQYYQFIDRQKLKGELKSFFIEDYILWMTKESTGVQRLDKEVRGIFWRNMPFPDALKQDLRKRSLVYDELCIKDNNRAMSDGYWCIAVPEKRRRFNRRRFYLQGKQADGIAYYNSKVAQNLFEVFHVPSLNESNEIIFIYFSPVPNSET